MTSTAASAAHGFGRTSWVFCAEMGCERKVAASSGHTLCVRHRPPVFQPVMRCVRCRERMPAGDVGLFCPGCRA